MLGQLVESSPTRVRRRFSTLVSFAAHAVVLSAAVAAARPVSEDPSPEDTVAWHGPIPLPPTECADCRSGSTGEETGRSDRDLPPLPGPVEGEITIDVPDPLGPAIEGPPISREEWRPGRAPQRGESGTAPLSSDVVDREVVPQPTNPVPRYPSALRTARVEGSVFARFVVDTTGRVLMESVSVEAADHPLFGQAVVEALRRSRYTPAELQGRKVSQLVVQPFVFVLRE